jgi:hypothetical protein
MSLYSFEGASGQSYDYFLLNFKNRAAFPMGGGNYLFARTVGSAFEVVCAGETDNMWTVFVSTTLWDIAKKEHGATAAYIHLNPDRRARQMESWDIVRKHRPPMNVDTLGEQAS